MTRLAAALLLFAALAPARTVTVKLYRQGIREIDLEDYVAGVIAGEGNTLPDEAQKALAVAARSYAVANLGRHRREGFDFCETTHCQDLRIDAVTPRAERATLQTDSELLWYSGSVASAFYSLHCGGRTELYPGAPYTTVQPDTFCVVKTKRPWTARIEGAHSVTVLERSPSGRVKTLSIDNRTVRWDGIEGALSNLFTVRAPNILEGYGAGHGIGLCQTGAAERARAGQSYRQILAFYYPGTRVGVSAQGFAWTRLSSERWELWTLNPSVDAPLLAAADRALTEAERRSQVRYQSTPRLRIYPTVQAYRDATGQSGATAATTLGRTVRMQTLPREAAAQVLLHESLHLTIEQRARPGLPHWFREGLVLHLANQPVQSPHSADGQYYQSSLNRVNALIKRYGAATVLGWLDRGLPKEVATTDNSVTHANTNSK